MGSGALYIGLMSGTSMDSLDAALLDFSVASPQLASPQLLATARTAFPADVRAELLSLCQGFNQNGESSDPRRQQELDQWLVQQFSHLALQLLRRQRLQAADICAIGSHGQTVFHRPPCAQRPPGQRTGYSLQIANPQHIAQLTGITTVGDFRNADMQAGGQGAPLVPAFHKALFHSAQRSRVIVNIGGMANITVLPASGTVTGFDTGPGNVLMDSWIQQHSTHAYDADGRWAAQETPDHELLHRLLQEPFFAQAPPKSTGRELFNLAWLQQQLAALGRALGPAVVQSTLAALTAHSIAEAIRDHAPGTQEIFVCGGGAHNKHLMQLLAKYTSLPVQSTATLGLDPDWVEAAAFAWLAKQTLENKPGNLPEVTGAARPVVLGKIYRPGK